MPHQRTDWVKSLGLAAAIAAPTAVPAGTPPETATRFPDPFTQRVDLSGDAGVLLARDKKGNPAMLGWWPKNTPPHKRTLTVSIISEMPEGRFYRHDKLMQAVGNNLCPVDDATESIIKECAEEFKNTYGITLNITRGDTKADYVIGGYRLPIMSSGFSTLPPGADAVQVKSNPRGHMFLNYDALKNADARELKRVIQHELLHGIMGVNHTFEMPEGSLSNNARHASSISYHNNHFVAPAEGMLASGPVDYALREYLPQAPELAQHNSTVQLNALNDAVSNGGISAVHPLHYSVQTILGGTNTTLSGTNAHHYIDLTPMTISRFQKADASRSLPFSIYGDGFEHITTAEGNDKVVLREGNHKQKLSLGTGTNDVQVYYPVVGDITLRPKGHDSLTFLASAIEGCRLHFEKNGNDAVLSLRRGENELSRFTLKEQMSDGTALRIRIVNNNGETVSECSAEGLKTTLSWNDALDRLQEKQQAAQWQDKVNHDNRQGFALGK